MNDVPFRKDGSIKPRDNCAFVFGAYQDVMCP